MTSAEVSPDSTWFCYVLNFKVGLLPIPEEEWWAYEELQKELEEWLRSFGMELVIFRSDGTHAYKIIGPRNADLDCEKIRSWLEKYDAFEIDFMDYPAE